MGLNRGLKLLVLKGFCDFVFCFFFGGGEGRAGGVQGLWASAKLRWASPSSDFFVDSLGCFS